MMGLTPQQARVLDIIRGYALAGWSPSYAGIGLTEVQAIADGAPEPEPAPPAPPASDPEANPRPKGRACGAREAVHATLLAGADANGIVVMSREAMCRPGGVSVNSMQKIIVALIGADLLQAVRPGAGLRNPVWRVFATPTPEADRAPLPPIPEPCTAAHAPRPRSAKPAVATPTTMAEREDRTLRLKPITDDLVRWTAAYVARGVRLDFLADLFDVDADLLRQAVHA